MTITGETPDGKGFMVSSPEVAEMLMKEGELNNLYAAYLQSGEVDKATITGFIEESGIDSVRAAELWLEASKEHDKKW